MTGSPYTKGSCWAPGAPVEQSCLRPVGPRSSCEPHQLSPFLICFSRAPRLAQILLSRATRCHLFARRIHKLMGLVIKGSSSSPSWSGSLEELCSSAMNSFYLMLSALAEIVPLDPKCLLMRSHQQVRSFESNVPTGVYLVIYIYLYIYPRI